MDSVGIDSITRRPLHGMFLWTRLVLVPSRGDHYTGCSCGLGWYWFHHEATITRDVPVDSVGTGSITRRPLHGMFLWTRLVLVPSRGDHYTGCSCGLGWYWFHHEATITRDVPVDSVGTGSITRRPLRGMFLWTRLVLVPSRGDHYTGCSCGLGWYWFHHEATITRDVPVDSVGIGSITRRPLHGMFLWTRLVLVPSRGDHYAGCSCGLGWYWFHHEATITRDVPVDSVGTGSITRRPLHGMFLRTRLVLVPSRGDHYTGCPLWTRLVLVPSRGDHLYSTLSCHFLLVS